MYSDVFRMYPRARVGKPSDTIKIQHARCEYKRILAHEGSMTLRYKVPYTIQARYKQDTVEYRCIPDVATGYSQDTSKIQSNTHVSQMYPARQSSTARGRALTLGRRLVLVILLLLDHLHLILGSFLARILRVVHRRTCGDTHERMYPVVSCCILVYPRGARVGPCVRGWIRVS